MELITTTELRTRSKELINTLLAGRMVDIVHHSRIVGEIRPKTRNLKIFDARKANKIAQALNLKPISDKELERKYRVAMIKKHGQSLSRYK